MLTQLRSRVADAAKLREFFGKTPKRSDYDMLLMGEGTVYKPDGERLLTVVKGGLSEGVVERCYEFFHGLRKYNSSNRMSYAGEERVKRRVGERNDNGTASKTARSIPIATVVVGALDRVPRIPFCRQSAPVLDNPAGWVVGQELVREAAVLFQQYVPREYAAQIEVARRTEPSFVIAGTPFTSITVNNTFAGAYHVDKGDYAKGFGVMVVLRRGSYRGCELVLPAYRTAVDLEHRDVIFFDVHEVHGNTPFVDAVGEAGVDHERISIVLYFREKMVHCKSPAEELRRAKSGTGVAAQ